MVSGLGGLITGKNFLFKKELEVGKMGYGDDHHPDLAHPLQRQRPKETGMTTCFNFENCPPLEEKIIMEVIMDNRSKDTNPKDAVGIKKAPISTVSGAVMMELGLAMMEGALKYGRHNYRVSGVRASVYLDALWRHMTAWWDFSQDDDPDSGLNHITKAIACLMVLRDSMILNNWVDDRPPPMPIELLKVYNEMAAALIKKYPNPKRAFTKDNAKKVEDEKVS